MKTKRNGQDDHGRPPREEKAEMRRPAESARWTTGRGA